MTTATESSTFGNAPPTDDDAVKGEAAAQGGVLHDDEMKQDDANNNMMMKVNADASVTEATTTEATTTTASLSSTAQTTNDDSSTSSTQHATKPDEANDKTTPTTAAPPPAPAHQPSISGMTIIPQLDYASIPSFENFGDLVHDDHYIRLPSNWHVIVTDICGSTKLIEAGRYRDVNTVGCMCICAVRNALLSMPAFQKSALEFGQEFPYVFGGDGATLVVAPHQHEAARAALCAVQQLAQENYQMTLRVGSVTIAELQQYRSNSDDNTTNDTTPRMQVQVAKYQIAPGLDIALFRGGGLALADTLIKAGQGQSHYETLFATLSHSQDEDDDDDDDSQEDDDDDPYLEGSRLDNLDDDEGRDETYDYRIQTPVTPIPEANLDGLSCRWKKIPNKHGCVLALLVMHNEDVYSNEFTTKSSNEQSTPKQNPNVKPSSTVLYKQVLDTLQEILKPQETLSSANPIHPDLAEYKSASEMIEDEHRMHQHKKRSFKFWTGRAPEIGLCHLLFKAKTAFLQHAIINAPAYVQGMRTHSDYCKFDDMLRMVIDCTPAQANQIEAYLQGRHEDGKHLFYGTHWSKHTLMTCFLKDTNEGNHIHFVDGDKGGYALAAKTLKMQLGNYALAKRNMALNLSSLANKKKKKKSKKKTTTTTKKTKTKKPVHP